MAEAEVYSLNERPRSAHSVMMNMVRGGMDVLDLGCNAGYLGVLLKQKGCRCWGLDRDGEAVRRIPDGVYEVAQVFNADRDEVPFQDMQFDAIILADVLEHVMDPLRLLDNLRARLKPKGCIVVSLPNVGHLSVRLGLLFGRFSYRESGILDRTHLHFYTLKSAKQLIESAGFAINTAVSASDHFGSIVNSPLGRPLRGLLTYNVVIQARAA